MTVTDPDEPGVKVSGVDVQVRRGDPAPEEVAAVVAVITEAYTAEIDAAIADEERTPTAWSRRQRPMRAPLRRDIPWGRFAG